MAKKKAKKAAAGKPAAKGKAAAPKGKPAAKKAPARKPAAPPDKTGAALHSLLGDLRGGPMKSEEE